MLLLQPVLVQHWLHWRKQGPEPDRLRSDPGAVLSLDKDAYPPVSVGRSREAGQTAEDPCCTFNHIHPRAALGCATDVRQCVRACGHILHFTVRKERHILHFKSLARRAPCSHSTGVAGARAARAGRVSRGCASGRPRATPARPPLPSRSRPSTSAPSTPAPATARAASVPALAAGSGCQ